MIFPRPYLVGDRVQVEPGRTHFRYGRGNTGTGFGVILRQTSLGEITVMWDNGVRNWNGLVSEVIPNRPQGQYQPIRHPLLESNGVALSLLVFDVEGKLYCA